MAPEGGRCTRTPSPPPSRTRGFPLILRIEVDTPLMCSRSPIIYLMTPPSSFPLREPLSAPRWVATARAINMPIAPTLATVAGAVRMRAPPARTSPLRPTHVKQHVTTRDALAGGGKRAMALSTITVAGRAAMTMLPSSALTPPVNTTPDVRTPTRVLRLHPMKLWQPKWSR